MNTSVESSYLWRELLASPAWIRSRADLTSAPSSSTVRPYLSTICTPSTRQEMITFLTMYSGSLCNVTKVPKASNISYFVHALQDHRRRFVRLLEFISFDPRAVQVMPLENFKKDPPGLWLIIQNSPPFSWLKNCLDQHDPSRKNIFSYIHLQCKLLKEQEIAAKQTENMFTGTSADQQRKDASAARYPARPNLNAIADSSPQLDSMLDSDPLAAEITLPPDEEYSYQDEAEAIASTSYDNDEVMEDFNYDNRAVVYSDVLDQKGYIQYVHETYFYPNQDPTSISALTTSPVTPVNKKDLPCFKFASQNCDHGDSCPYSHKKEKISEYLNSHHAGVTRSK